MRSAKLFLLTVLSLVFAGAMAFANGNAEHGTSAKQGKEPIRIGILTTMTGNYSLIGHYTKQGVKMAVDSINAGGGVLGRPVEAVYEDDGAVTSQAVDAFNRLVSADKVVAVVGSILSPIDLAVEPLDVRAQIPMVVLGSNVKLTKVDSWAFRPRAIDSLSAKALALFVVQTLHFDKVGVLNSTDAFAQGYANIVVPTLKENGVNPVAVATFNDGDKDYTAQLLQMKKAGAKIVIMVAQQADAGLIMKQYYGLGLQSQYKIAGSNSFITETAIKLSGKEAANGVYALADYVPSNPAPVSQAFTKAYVKAYGSEPEFDAAFTHDAVLFIADAIKRAGSTDPQKIRTAMYATKDLQGVTQPITCQPTRECGTQALIVQYVDGKIKVIKALHP
jgi:branched-chain amino acid transport system substrate-binding protein